MTLGEIKIESLMLMFADLNPGCASEEDISGALLSLRGDDNYKFYLNSICGSVNRCFSSLEQKGILPSKQADITPVSGTNLGGKLRFELKNLIPDIFMIEKIHVHMPNGTIYLCEYDTEGQGTIIVNNIENAIYTVIYIPKIPRVTLLTPPSKEIDLPEDIASVIPYFVKGDLFRYENSAEATESRNIYEAMCDEMIECKNSVSYFSNSVYSLGRL